MTKALALLIICVGCVSLLSFASERQPCQPLTPTTATPFDTCRYLPLGTGIHTPKVVRNPDPDYSEIASKTNLRTGSVALVLAVNEKGFIDDVKVVRSSDSRVEPTAIDAVKQWAFTPATRDGKPVAIQIHVEMSFHLQ